MLRAHALATEDAELLQQPGPGVSLHPEHHRIMTGLYYDGVIVPCHYHTSKALLQAALVCTTIFLPDGFQSLGAVNSAFARRFWDPLAELLIGE